MPMEYLWGLIGGLMIGGAASIYLLFNGRIMGISGIFGGLVDGTGWSSWPDRVVFIAGLVAVPALLALILPGTTTHLTGNWLVIIAGGLLVGVGTRLANGCTSGHGVCGISRLSPRGIAATLAYVGAGVLAISLLRHVWGLI
jgi:uncharacterized protein